MEEIKNKLFQITKAVKSADCTDRSLFSGQGGISLLLGYSDTLFPDTGISEAFETSLETSLGLFDSDSGIYSFGGGFSGVCWAFNHMAEKKMIDTEAGNIFEEIEPHLIAASEREMEINYFDFIHGALGAAVYFLDRLPSKKSQFYLEGMVKEIKRHAKKCESGIYWINAHLKEEDELDVLEFNLGLSHGIPSIVWFLAKCYENNIERDLCKSMLEPAIAWLMSRKNQAGSLSLFPSVILDQIPHMTNRLAWCYGDTGIASVIWQAGKALGVNEWKSGAIEIMTHAAERRNLELNFVEDAGICHGSAGIAHQFNRFYFETKLPVFKEAADFWIGETLKMACHADGLAGFKTLTPDNQLVNEYGLLEGVAGIGLVLYSFLSGEEPSWDRCLLLS